MTASLAILYATFNAGVGVLIVAWAWAWAWAGAICQRPGISTPVSRHCDQMPETFWRLKRCRTKFRTPR